MSRDTGITIPTVKSWITVLEASYIVYLLQPYYKNFGKRLIKSPKLYFIDSAVVCALTKQPDADSALAGSMGGAFFEGWIISETVKVFTNKGLKPDIYYWRSHDGLEVDLIIQSGSKLIPVEIKLTATPSLKHTEPLNKFKSIAGNLSSDTGILVCQVEKITALPFGNIALPWSQYIPGVCGQFPSSILFFWTRSGKKQVFISPDLNYSAAIHADKWIPILPNTDAALAAGDCLHLDYRRHL